MANYLHQSNLGYIETLLSQYQDNPNSLEPTWRSFFDGVEFASKINAAAQSSTNLDFELKVLQLIQNYREMGHLIADINPLDRSRKTHPLLALSNFGLSETDLARNTQVAEMLGLKRNTVGDVLKFLEETYCRAATIEYEHISSPRERKWLQMHVESGFLAKAFSADWKQRIHQKLLEAEGFDLFLHKRFIGQKRFSAEGNDALIPMLEYFVHQAAEAGVEDVVMGMAHRGRLNVLAYIFEKDVSSIMAQFEGSVEISGSPGEGDVKYHLGYACERKISDKKIKLSLVPNPSHLETVNPVVQGIVRAKQKQKKDTERSKVISVLMHGDASFAGQGIIYEGINMSELPGYTVGGTLHIIINNQIGFTTLPADGRSTPNPTDIAKMLSAPIFHVNADEPEMAVRVMELAFMYRQQFKRDVFINLVGYRRYGHNESDEPSFTQPLQYSKIAKHPRVREQYEKKLLAENNLSTQAVEANSQKIEVALEAALSKTRSSLAKPDAGFAGEWSKLQPANEKTDMFVSARTQVPLAQLQSLSEKLITLPQGFTAHSKLKRILDDRREMFTGKRGLDWACGESLAFASLLADGFPVRISGQDVTRGTFSHRHAGIRDINTGELFVPCNQVNPQADLELVNSLLSEYAVLGFEFGQSMSAPNKLTIWEAQFGDFANGAQIIIDQLVVSSLQKWNRASGLVMLLPHGYEGQGPEHSSARLERFLQACAQNNIQVCNFSTPAQYFHALRRQLKRNYRLPMIVMSPKSLLRHPQAVSSMEDLAQGQFHEILNDPQAADFAKAERVVITSGKIYYDLVAKRNELKLNTPIVRIEQYYPFAAEQLKTALSGYKKAKSVVWCQEEPANMGAWTFLKDQIAALLDDADKLQYVGRPRQASPSGGYAHIHEQEQQTIVAAALAIKSK